MKPTEILALPMSRNDAGAKTVRDYLKALLFALWDRRDGFSGKRPFGNGAWEFELYIPLVTAGLAKGSIDADGGLEEYDRAACDALIEQAIDSL